MDINGKHVEMDIRAKTTKTPRSNIRGDRDYLVEMRQNGTYDAIVEMANNGANWTFVANALNANKTYVHGVFCAIGKIRTKTSRGRKNVKSWQNALNT